MLKAVHSLKTSRLHHHHHRHRDLRSLLGLRTYLANLEDAPPADAVMGDAAADSPAKIDDPNEVDLEEDDIDYDFDK